MAVEDRMSKIREIQAAAAAKKESEARAAAEAAEKTLESKEGERTQVEVEIGNTTQELAKSESALAEVSAIDLAELDADSQAAIKGEIEGIQAEAEAFKAKIAELSERKAVLDGEIATLSGEGSASEGSAMSEKEKDELNKLKEEGDNLLREERHLIDQQYELFDSIKAKIGFSEDDLEKELTPEQAAQLEGLTDIESLKDRTVLLTKILKPSIFPGKDPVQKAFLKAIKSSEFAQAAAIGEQVATIRKKQDEIRNEQNKLHLAA